MTADQYSDEYRLGWLHERLEGECLRIEYSSDSLEWMGRNGVTTQDVLYVLRNSTSVSSRYAGDCFVLYGEDLDGRWVSIVVAPPSKKNRVWVVKIWKGE